MVRWFTAEYSNHIAYDFNGRVSGTELGDWEITKLPENYRQSERINLESMVCVLYDNGDTDMEIELNYQLLSEGNGFNLDNEWHTVSNVQIGEKTGQLFAATEEGGSNMVFWVDAAAEHAFLLTSRLPCDVLLELAKSVASVEN